MEMAYPAIATVIGADPINRVGATEPILDDGSPMLWFLSAVNPRAFCASQSGLGAAVCAAFMCGSHDRGHNARADQVPAKIDIALGAIRAAPRPDAVALAEVDRPGATL